jgi:hypothetical protein
MKLIQNPPGHVVALMLSSTCKMLCCFCLKGRIRLPDDERRIREEELRREREGHEQGVTPCICAARDEPLHGIP